MVRRLGVRRCGATCGDAAWCNWPYHRDYEPLLAACPEIFYRQYDTGCLGTTTGEGQMRDGVPTSSKCGFYDNRPQPCLTQTVQASCSLPVSQRLRPDRIHVSGREPSHTNLSTAKWAELINGRQGRLGKAAATPQGRLWQGRRHSLLSWKLRPLSTNACTFYLLCLASGAFLLPVISVFVAATSTDICVAIQLLGLVNQLYIEISSFDKTVLTSVLSSITG